MSIPNPIVLDMDVTEPQVIPMTVSEAGGSISMTVGVSINLVAGQHYQGATTVTPTQEQQILLTQGKVVDANIIVEPIPSNYGLITWNGSVLRIS